MLLIWNSLSVFALKSEHQMLFRLQAIKQQGFNLRPSNM
jgi:hypothetical protein